MRRDHGTTQRPPAEVLQTSQRLSANTDMLISDGSMFNAGAGTDLSYHFATVCLSVLLLTRSQLPMHSFSSSSLLVLTRTPAEGQRWQKALCVRAGWHWTQHTPSLLSVTEKYSSSPSLIITIDFPTWHSFQLNLSHKTAQHFNILVLI